MLTASAKSNGPSTAETVEMCSAAATTDARQALTQWEEKIRPKTRNDKNDPYRRLCCLIMAMRSEVTGHIYRLAKRIRNDFLG